MSEKESPAGRPGIGHNRPPEPIEPLVVDTVKAAALLDVGKTKLFQLLRDGLLDSVKLGSRSRRITMLSIRRLAATGTATGGDTGEARAVECSRRGGDDV